MFLVFVFSFTAMATEQKATIDKDYLSIKTLRIEEVDLPIANDDHMDHSNFNNDDKSFG